MPVAPANPYQQLRAAAIGRCSAIDPAESRTGLIFNPDGFRSFHPRSACFQEAAETFRDHSLCKEVRQRRSLFLSSWGYSPDRCRELVTAGIDADRRAIALAKQSYRQQRVELAGFRVEQNGNGRDFDVVPEFRGNASHGYRLLLTVEPRPAPGGAGAVVLHDQGYYLEGASSRVRIYLPAAEIRRRFPPFALQQDYAVTAILEYSIGTGSQAGRWSEAFIDSNFPAEQRRQRVSRVIRFGDLPAPGAARGH